MENVKELVAIKTLICDVEASIAERCVIDRFAGSTKSIVFL